MRIVQAIWLVLAMSFAATPSVAENSKYVFRPVRASRLSDEAVDAGVQAATRACDPAQNLSYGSKKFKGCMRKYGYTLDHVEREPDAAATAGRYIDPDSGMDCQTTPLGVAVCDPPQGTVHYVNRHGLNCQRTGLAAFCTNF